MACFCIFAIAIFLENLYHDEKEKNKNLVKQINYYEEKIKNVEYELEKTRKDTKHTLLDVGDKNKKFKSENEKLKERNNFLEVDMECKKDEFFKLHQEVKEQKKTIDNLRDVIKYLEEEIKNRTIKA